MFEKDAIERDKIEKPFHETSSDEVYELLKYVLDSWLYRDKFKPYQDLKEKVKENLEWNRVITELTIGLIDIAINSTNPLDIIESVEDLIILGILTALAFGEPDIKYALDVLGRR